MKGVRVSELATPVILAAILATIAGLTVFVAPTMQRPVTEALIYIVVVVGLQIFSGNSGLISFGHIAFMVVGAYVSAILTLSVHKKHSLLALPAAITQLQLPMMESLVLSSLAAALVALVIGFPILRLRGIVPSMATFALLMITHVVTLNWKAVTGGRQALVGLPLDTTIWVALAGAVLAIGIAVSYQQSIRGVLLRCTRENIVAAESIGINIVRERMFAWVISAFVCGAGGVLFAHFLGTLNANTFFLDTTFLVLSMLVVGGYRSVTGAVVGVAVLSLVSEFFRALEQGVQVGGFAVPSFPGLQEVALALIMLAILIARPDGLSGAREVGRAYSKGVR
jgi:branched-chain amino acid transport system permease protein